MINADDDVKWAYLLEPTFELTNTGGKPLTGGWLEVYIHGSRTKYYCALDWSGTLHPFQIPLDSLGSNIVLASPANSYDIYVYNKFGSLVMSRYNVQPRLGAGEIVHDEITLSSSDGTVTIEASGNTNYDLSIADTVSAVSGLDIRVQDLESSVTGIQEALSGKKDVQAPYNASGTNVQTITSVTQDANGVISVEYSDIQAQNPLTPGQYVTIDDNVISVTGLQPEGDYATKDYVDAAVSGLEPIDITSSDGSITVSSSVSGSVKVFDISVSGGQPVYFRGGETWIPVSGTTADFSVVKKFDGTIVPSDIVSGTVPLEDGLWAWDAIVDIYVGGHVNELVKCGIKGQAVGGAYDPDSETELLIDSTRPGVINSFTLTGLSRGGPNTRLAFTFTRENSSTSTMWVRMRRLSVYQVKGPGVSQSGGGGDYEAGWGIIINGDVISVNNAIIPDIDTVSGMIIDATGDFATRTEVNTVSGAIVDMIPEVEITPTLVSGTKIAEYSVDGVSGELFAPFNGEVVFVTTSNTYNEIADIIDSGKIPVLKYDAGQGYFYYYLEDYDDAHSAQVNKSITFKGGRYPHEGTTSMEYWKIRQNNNTWIHEFADLNGLFARAGGAVTINGGSNPETNYRSRISVNTDGTTIHVNENNELEVIGGGGSSYTAGSGIDITNNVISVSGVALSSDLVNADWDAVSGLSEILNKPETVVVDTVPVSAGSGISITDTGSGIVISCTASGGGSDVTITPTLASGTKIAEYSIDGVSGEIYAPEGGGSSDSTKIINEHIVVTTPDEKTAMFNRAGDIDYQEFGRTAVQSLSYGSKFAYVYEPWNYCSSNDTLYLYTYDYITDDYHLAWFPSGSTARYIRYKQFQRSGNYQTYYIYDGSDTPRNVGSGYYRYTVPAPTSTSADFDTSKFDIVGDWSSVNTPILIWYLGFIDASGNMISTGLTDSQFTTKWSLAGSRPKIKLKSGGGISQNPYSGLYVTNPVPSSTSSDENKVLTVNSSGTPEWQPAQGGGSTYTAGDYISIENDEISVTGIDPDSFASQADLEAVSAAIPSGSYDLVAGQNITITASGTDLIISGQQGGTNVTITPDYNSGTRVARYSIDGVNGSIYTPTQVNANWNETSSSSKAYIQNKPTIHTYTGASGVVIDSNDVVSLDSPVELVPGANITIEVSGVSAIISSTGGGGGGTTYTAGNMISLTNNAIAVSTTAGITDIQTVASLPANPVSTVLYLIPEA